jgi:Protein of unknown function (DUF1566)
MIANRWLGFVAVVVSGTTAVTGCGGSSSGPADGGRPADGGQRKDGGVVGDRPAADAADAEAGTGISCGFVMPNPLSTGLPNPMSYDTSMPGIAVDEVTGLMWERMSTGQTASEGCTVGTTGILACPYRYAVDHCTANRLGGYSDWRLPTVLELLSLVDFTQAGASIDPVTFADTPLYAFWSITRLAGHLDDAWMVDFSLGNDLSDFIDNPHSVRCVRGGTTPPSRCYPTASRFTVQDGLVADTATGLTWQQTSSGDLPSPQLQTYCAGLAGGFRLPSIKELFTLVDFSGGPYLGPTMDMTAFPQSDFFDLSSSGVVGQYMYLWGLAFADAKDSPEEIENGVIADARCVR